MNAGQSIRELFHEASALQGEARQQWLLALREADPGKAAQLERMLGFDADDTDPFSGVVDSAKRRFGADAEVRVGDNFAGFRIQHLLGEGGMGAVYLAEREGDGFRQQVALKLLRAVSPGQRALGRFAAERRILARLNHPNIATLIDGGLAQDGRPYLAMEYIDGQPLLMYCDAQRLTVPQRLRLVQGLLSALAYAHRALVVHRDLKPGNVLVTPDGTPKLLDFGIARLLEDEAASATTVTQVFTPNYASPEQLAGEPITTASDIYSLGLMLYQLCVGVQPWMRGERSRSGGVATAALTRFHQQDEDKRRELAALRDTDAGKLARRLRGDLGAVLARCLALDPAERYGTVEALQRDIEAIIARQPPPGVHVSRPARVAAFARRHAWPVALAALVLVAGVVLLAQSLINQQRLQHERDQARVAQARAEHVAGFVEDMLGGIDPDKAHGMDRSLLRLILDQAGQRAAKELAGEPAVRVAVERTIAESYSAIGEYQLAAQHFAAALAVTDPSPAKRSERVTLRVNRARAQASAGFGAKARSTLDRALDAARVLPADDPARLVAEITHAGFACDAGQLQTCRDRYAELLPRMQKALGKDDDDTLKALHGLALAESGLANFPRARELFQQLLVIDKEKYGMANSHTLSAINGLAITHLRQEQFAKAEALLEPAVAQATKTLGPSHPFTINMLSNLGGAIRQQPGRNAEAKPYYEKVLKANIALYGADSLRTAVSRSNLAALLRDAGQLRQAEQQARRAVAAVDKAAAPDSPYRAVLRNELVSILLREKQYAAAEEVLGQAWSILAKAQGVSQMHPDVQALIRQYVDLYTAWGKPKKAARWRSRLASGQEMDGTLGQR